MKQEQARVNGLSTEWVSLDVRDANSVELPASTIAFVHSDSGAIKALIVDATTGEMRSVVHDDRDGALATLVSRITARGTGSAIMLVGADPVSEIVVPTTPTVPPIGGGGGKGFPKPPFLDIVRAFALLAHVRPREP